MNENRYSSSSHACFDIHYHLVVVTKYRHPVLVDQIETRLKEITLNVFEKQYGCKVVEMECNKDHIHILFDATPQIVLVKLINTYKTVSSRLLRNEFGSQLASFYWEPKLWSRSYYIGTVGHTTQEIVRSYIKHQKI